METTNTNEPPNGERKSPRVIKRYANRKLYDTRDSRYVTLLQIAEYVRSGEDVTIIDNTTKEDLTNATLAQIVYEAEKASADKAGETGKPKTMGALRSLIQNGGELFQTSSERLMSTLREGPMGKLIARRDEPEKAEKPEGEAKVDAKAESDEPAKSERKNLLLSPKEAIDELQRLADERVKTVLDTAIQSVHQLQGEVMRLHTRIEELEQRLVEVQKRRNSGGPDDEPAAASPRDSERKTSNRS